MIFTSSISSCNIKIPSEFHEEAIKTMKSINTAKFKQQDSEMEKSCLISLKKAANIISKNPTALKLKYMETLRTIVLKGKTTIVYPFPI